MKKLTALLSLVLFLPIIPLSQPTTGEQPFQAELIFEISTAGQEYLLSSPRHVRTDSEGNIYIGDRRTLDLKIFDSEGEYLQTIGGSGRGPGEFARLNAMYIDKDDRLVVADHFQSRITLFNRNLEEENTYVYKTDEIMWPRKIIGFRDSLLIGYALHIPSEQLGLEDVGFDVSQRNMMFHLMERDLGPIQTDFGDLRSLAYPEEYPTTETFRYETEISVGSILAFDHTSVLFAHALYNGTLHRMYVDGRVETSQGYARYDDPFTYETVDGERDVVHSSESMGLFQLESGNFVHFTKQHRQEGNIKDVYVEIFDEKLQLKRYGPLEGLEYDYFFVEHYADGRVYGIAWTDEAPRVSVIRINDLE